MLQVNVALPNGQTELLSLLPSSTVQDLRTLAQRAFGKKYLRLITAKNRVLVNPEETLEETEIEDGECLAALVLQPQLAATDGAFAVWCHGDNAIVTWGFATHGGDSSAVQDQLKGVQQIQATDSAFAAILADGSVVTWGPADSGGDSAAVREQLRGVQQIQATQGAFAAILADGSVVTWGDARLWWWLLGSSRSAQGCAADSSHKAGPLLRFWKMDPSSPWGDADCGGDSSAVQGQLRGVQQIQATPNGAFAAILEDGSVVTWGDADFGGDSSEVRDQLKGVQQIQAGAYAFAAILADGSVVTWGDVDSWVVQDQLRGVQQIQSTCRAFAAILEDGSVVAWGYADFWVRDISDISVRDQLRGVWQIQATNAAFAAILGDGSVVSWGDRSFGGDR